MVGFFPPLFPDELFYSGLARCKLVYRVDSASVSSLYFGRGDIVPSFLFASNLRDFLAHISGADSSLSYSRIIFEHTMFPLYCDNTDYRFASRALHTMIYGDTPKVESLLGACWDESLCMKWCPECVMEDTDVYGVPYWHRSHQLSFNLCPKHCCKTIDGPRIYSKNRNEYHLCGEIERNDLSGLFGTVPRFSTIPADKAAVEVVKYQIDRMSSKQAWKQPLGSFDDDFWDCNS